MEGSVRIVKAGPVTGHPPADRARGGEPSVVVPDPVAPSVVPEPDAGAPEPEAAPEPEVPVKKAAPASKPAKPSLT